MNQTTFNKTEPEIPENKYLKGDAFTDSLKVQESPLTTLEDRKSHSIGLSNPNLSKKESNSGEWHDHSTRGDISNENDVGCPLSISNVSIAASLEDQEGNLIFRSEDNVEGGQVGEHCEVLSPAQPEEITLGPVRVETELRGQDNIPKELKLWASSLFENSAEASYLRKSFAVLASICVGSMAALDVKDAEELVSILFSVACSGLIYQIFEDAVQYYDSLRGQNHLPQKWEYLFEIADKAFLVIFLLNLYSKAVFGGLLMFLTPSLFVIEIMIYVEKSSLRQSEKETRVILKAFYLIQSFLIELKVNGFVDYEWKWILLFLWIYLGAYACYALFTGVLLLSAGLASFMQVNRETFSFLKGKVVGYIWHIPYYALNGVAFFVLVGILQKIDTKSEEILLSSLRYAKNISTFLLIYTFFMFPTLKKLDMASFSVFGGSFVQDRTESGLSKKTKKILLKTQDHNKAAFFLMISPTYFRRLEDKKLIEDLENPQQEEDMIQCSCYICESNESNAILTGCGHGGVCCDCVVKSLERKNECMECRKPVEGVYKINEDSGKQGVVKAHEIIQVATVD